MMMKIHCTGSLSLRTLTDSKLIDSENLYHKSCKQQVMCYCNECGSLKLKFVVKKKHTDVTISFLMMTEIYW